VFSTYNGRIMKNILVVLTILGLTVSWGSIQGGDLYISSKGKINFLSDAPLELIKASSNKLAGILNTDQRSFAFSIPVKSFEGFNSGLQRTHFNENYLESEKYPNATFEGKIIEDIDFNTPGEHRVRAKGILGIHGIKQNRIIRSTLKIQKDEILINSTFTVPLADHNIKIPSIVSQKIAEEIYIEVECTLIPKK
jgi:hypothetical protein